MSKRNIPHDNNHNQAIPIEILDSNVSKMPIDAMPQADLFQDLPLPISLMIQPQFSKTAQSPDLVRSGGEEYFAKQNGFIDHAYTLIQDGFKVKIIESNSLAAEMIGYRLAQFCGIKVPTFAVLIDQESNQLFFGSRRINEEFVPSIRSEMMMLSGEIADGFFQSLWKIFALDCFIGNIDRHNGNYLAYKENNQLCLVAIDYGLSNLAIHNWDVGHPHEQTNTRKNWEAFKKILNLNQYYVSNRNRFKDSALQMLESMKYLSDDAKRNLAFNIPNEWLSHIDANEFYNWLNGHDYLSRIDETKRFISHE